MLDTLIIARIRRERKSREGRIPLRIEEPIPMYRPPQPQEQKKERGEKRGIAIIDFTI